MNKEYGRLKKQDLINELEKRDNEITDLDITMAKWEELLKKAAYEINALELSLMSARMFMGHLLKLHLEQVECNELYIEKKEAYDLFESHHVDFAESDRDSEGKVIGVLLKLVENPTPEQEVNLENVPESEAVH